jgi:hypothetical protein
MAETNEQTPNAGGDGKTSEQKTTEQKPKIEFSSEQQTFVNELINGTFGKAWEKAEATFGPKITALETKLAELSTPKTGTQQTPKIDEKKPEEKGSKAKSAPQDEANAALQAQLDELRSIAEQLKQDKLDAEKRATDVARQNKTSRIKEAFIGVSDKVSFFDRMSEYKHMENQLDEDETGNIIVLNPATKLPRLNTSLQPMTLEEFVQDYAKQKPWTVKAAKEQVAGGSGAGDSRKLATKQEDKVVDFAKLSNEELLAEAEKVIAKQYQR